MFAKSWLAVLAIGCAQAQQWTPELQMRVKTVADVTPSRDGKMVAWVETRALMDGEKSEMNSQIYIAHADGSERLQLTRGEKSATAPEFSPDGHFVYFTSEREGKRGFYRVPVDGGEAESIGPAAGVMAGAYHLSPNGKWLAFTGTAVRPDVELARKEKRDFRVIDENPTNASLYLISADADINGKRTSRRLATGPFSVGGFDWSPDSRTIAFETRPGPGADFGRKSDLSEVEVESGKIQALATTEASEASPRYSPDGRYLAFVRSQGTGGLAPNRIVLFSRAGGKLRELPASPDEQPNLLGWSGDSKRMFFAEAKGTREVLYGIPVDGPPAPVFTPKGTFGAVKLNRAGTHAGIALQSFTEPVEAYSMDLATMKPVRVSAANSGLALPPLGETSVIRWKGKDGKSVEGNLTLPVGYEKGTAHPQHPRRTRRRLQRRVHRRFRPLSDRFLRREGLRSAASQSAGLGGLWQRFQKLQRERLGRGRLPGSDGRRRPCDLDGRCRSGQTGGDGLELRRLHDQLGDRPDQPFQSSGYGRGAKRSCEHVGH
jgi:dipeptidyl aminopeptidase/acylaminoacyl peptidase